MVRVPRKKVAFHPIQSIIRHEPLPGNVDHIVGDEDSSWRNLRAELQLRRCSATSPNDTMAAVEELVPAAGRLLPGTADKMARIQRRFRKAIKNLKRSFLPRGHYPDERIVQEMPTNEKRKRKQDDEDVGCQRRYLLLPNNNVEQPAEEITLELFEIFEFLTVSARKRPKLSVTNEVEVREKGEMT